MRYFALLFLVATVQAADELPPLSDDYCKWHQDNLAISAPLCDLIGNAERGRKVVIDGHAGNCLACHVMPIEEEPLHGTVGPPLHHVASRLTLAQIRLRVVDEQQINPQTIMPGFYRDPRIANRVADDYWGKTFLSAQQVEDVVAYLATLK